MYCSVMRAFCRRSCDQCMMDNDCGFCYIKSDAELAVNGSCLAAERDEQGHIIFTESSYGRCHQSTLHDPLHWAYGFCPTDFAWMATFGLVLYLMFFAPGSSLLYLLCCYLPVWLLSFTALFDFYCDVRSHFSLILLPTTLLEWRILSEQSFTVHMPLLTATCTFRLGSRHWNSCQ